MSGPARSEQWHEDQVAEFLGQITAGGAGYRRLIERLPAVVYASEKGPEGRWRYVSPQIEEILGYTQEEWMADPGLWARRLHPDDRERTLAQERADGEEPNGTRPIDYRMITRDGDVVWILDEAVLEPDEEGNPIWHGVLYDITERKLAEDELRAALAQQATVARLSSHALQLGDPESLMREATALVTELEGIEAACVWEAEREGRRLLMLAGSEVQAQVAERRASAGRGSHAAAAIDSGLHVIVDDWQSETRFEMPPALRPLAPRSSLAVPIAGKDRAFGVLDLYALEPNRFTPQDVHFAQASANVLADAVERHAADLALRHRAHHDPLTGLPNRVSFVESVESALRRGSAAGNPVCVLFLDLDNFKHINDNNGHHAGDELLRLIAPRLRAHLRPGDIVARFGGDEFGILVERVDDEDEAAAIANRVTEAFSEPFAMAGAECHVTASVGVAVARPSRAKPVMAEELIRDADQAMYLAKARGRARYELFDAEMRARVTRRQEMEAELSRAMERGELTLHYQPVVTLGGGEVLGFEALLRWEHPERGTLDPAEIVSVAEESGLIESVGRWVQDTACRQVVAWQEMRPDSRPLALAVNLSVRQVADRDLAGSVRDVLARTGLEPSRLRLEVTESALVGDAAAATATLEALSELGVQLVLDDFGTGYSSLAYLNRFPFDALKVDRSFVLGLGIEQEHGAIVEAILAMARALGLEAIAEGVETETQLAELRRLGCRQAQGHLFSRPLEAERVTRLIEEGTLDLLGDAAR